MAIMSSGDRSVLGGLVAAMIFGVGGSLAIATSCLERDRAHRNQDHAGFPEDKSARTSAGGIPGEEADAAVSTTHITAAELPPAGAAAATTNAPPAEPNADASPPAPYTNRLEPAETPRPAAPAPAATPVPSPVPTSTTSAGPAVADAGATTPGSALDAGTSVRDASATTTTSAIAGRAFATEPSDPYGASAFESNREAGAGPFTTEW